MSALATLAIVVVIGLTSVLGGVTGFGAALLATPALLVLGVDVTDAVVVNLMIGLTTRAGTAAQLIAHVELRWVAFVSAGCLPGILLGALTLELAPQSTLKLIAGLVVIACGVLMARRPRTEPRTPTRRTQVSTGLLSGYLSATTSLTGPPPALLLLRSGATPIAFIANISAYFVVACAATLTALAIQGRLIDISLWPWMPALIAAALVGNRFGIAVAHRVTGSTFRAILIVLVIAAGIGTCLAAW